MMIATWRGVAGESLGSTGSTSSSPDDPVSVDSLDVANGG
jgi:hypothetical protein